MNKDYSGFAIRLNWLMTKKEISNRKLAEAIKINENTIASWKNNAEKIDSITALSKLAIFFDVKVDWLLYGRIGD